MKLRCSSVSREELHAIRYRALVAFTILLERLYEQLVTGDGSKYLMRSDGSSISLLCDTTCIFYSSLYEEFKKLKFSQIKNKYLYTILYLNTLLVNNI